MATKTTNYNLTKPSYNESADISVINQNMDIIDEKMKEIENAGGGGGGSSVTVDSELSTTSKNPVQNKVVTQALNGKGTYSKPTGGIPKTDLASEVQTSLGKADTALQEHQDISGKADKTEVTAIFNSISDAWNSATAYTVGQYCIYNNALWKCLVANTNTEPAEGTYWTHTTIDAEISAINSNFVNCLKKSDVVNNLTTTTTNVPLSAAQGKVLNDKITNLSKSTTLLASISTNTANPYALGASIKSYRYIYIKVTVDGNTDTLFIQSSLCSNSEKHCYRCWGNDSYYVEGHIKFNSDTTVTVTQDVVKGWTGNPGAVVIYGIN